MEGGISKSGSHSIFAFIFLVMALFSVSISILSILSILAPDARAALSDLYDFRVHKIDVSTSFYGSDSDSNGQKDTLYANISLNGSGKYIISFDVLWNGVYVAHKESNITGGFNGGITRVGDGNYKIFLVVQNASMDSSVDYLGRDTSVLFKDEFLSTASGFEPYSFTIKSEPTNLDANYQFFDTNNNSHYDVLVVEPAGSIRIYDAYGDFVISTENNQISLGDLYNKGVECPCRIVDEFQGQTYEAVTDDKTYLEFERPQLADLSIGIQSKNITIENKFITAFNFYISIYEGDNLAMHPHIQYLNPDEKYIINYSATNITKAYVDFENNVEEANETNNFADHLLAAIDVDGNSTGNSTGNDSIDNSDDGSDDENAGHGGNGNGYGNGTGSGLGKSKDKKEKDDKDGKNDKASDKDKNKDGNESDKDGSDKKNNGDEASQANENKDQSNASNQQSASSFFSKVKVLLTRLFSIGDDNEGSDQAKDSITGNVVAEVESGQSGSNRFIGALVLIVSISSGAYLYNFISRKQIL